MPANLNRKPNNLADSEQGIVAIVVSIILIIILSLITIGFANLVRREQRQALDRQLSSEAFYAAESAINDTVDALKVPNSSVISTNNCTNTDSVLDKSRGVSVPCVLVDRSLPQLEYG